MKKLFYTVAVAFEGTPREMLINVYEIADNQPTLFCQIESFYGRDVEVDIQVYLDNNGYGDEEFIFEHLE